MDSMTKLGLLVVVVIVGGLAVIYTAGESFLGMAYESEYGEPPP